MLINEGLPMHLVELARRQIDLTKATTGVLGMAFKAECDNPEGFAKLQIAKDIDHPIAAGPLLRSLCSDAWLVPVEQVLQEADVLFVGTPHKAYRGLHVPDGKIVIDILEFYPTKSAGIALERV